MATESSFERPASGYSYLALFVIVFCAVTAGNLASTWIASHLAIIEVRAAAASMEKRKAAADQRLAIQAGERVQRERIARLTDPVATRLGRDCDDWSAADSKLRTPTTHAEAQKRCEAYQRYVETGEQPPR